MSTQPSVSAKVAHTTDRSGNPRMLVLISKAREFEEGVPNFWGRVFAWLRLHKGYETCVMIAPDTTAGPTYYGGEETSILPNKKELEALSWEEATIPES